MLKAGREETIAAELECEELGQQVGFLAEEHDQADKKLHGMRLAKEKAIVEANDHWSILNGRLRSRKTTSELLARNLQQELIQLRVAHERAAWAKPPS